MAGNTKTTIKYEIHKSKGWLFLSTNGYVCLLSNILNVGIWQKSYDYCHFIAQNIVHSVCTAYNKWVKSCLYKSLKLCIRHQSLCDFVINVYIIYYNNKRM